MNALEKFLKGEPLNDRMATLMEEGDYEPELSPDDLAEAKAAMPLDVALAALTTDDNREHLRRLMLEPGWQVLLQLLDNDIARLEDAAKRISRDPLRLEPGTLTATWAEVSYQRKARERIVSLAEEQVAKLKRKKKACHDAGAIPTQTATN